MKRNGERTHTCRSPTLTLNGWNLPPPTLKQSLTKNKTWWQVTGLPKALHEELGLTLFCVTQNMRTHHTKYTVYEKRLCVMNIRWSVSEAHLPWASTLCSPTYRSPQPPLHGRIKKIFKGTQNKYGKLGTIDTGTCSLALPSTRQTSIFDSNVHHRLQLSPNWSSDKTGKAVNYETLVDIAIFLTKIAQCVLYVWFNHPLSKHLVYRFEGS